MAPVRATGVATGLAAGATLAASLIHFASVAGHLEESGLHGSFLLTAGWVQLALAVGVGFGVRPPRGWLAATVLANGVIAGVWLAWQTVGLPAVHVHSSRLSDGTATALEVLALVAAVAVLAGAPGERRLAGRSVLSITGAALVGVVASVSVAVGTSLADESSGHGDHGDHGDSASAENSAHGSHGGSHADSGTEDWDEARMAALEGYLRDNQLDELRQIMRDFLTEQIREGSTELQSLPEAERDERIETFVEWSVDNALSADGSAGGQVGMHTDETEEWRPITDAEGQLELQAQLSTAATIVERYPSVKEAEAAGYTQVAPYLPGMGAHWLNVDLLDEFDPAAPAMLLYNGHEQTSELVGASYSVIDPDGAPSGFVGDNDVWHNHPTQCSVAGLIVGNEGSPEDLCESIGGSITSPLKDLWMLHLWQVPGWESPWGLFSAENPTVNAATSDFVLGPS
jgi:hypothetical protein